MDCSHLAGVLFLPVDAPVHILCRESHHILKFVLIDVILFLFLVAGILILFLVAAIRFLIAVITDLLVMAILQVAITGSGCRMSQ